MNKKKLLQGLVKRHPDGFGFLVPDDSDHPDVYIPRHSMTGVMTNDKVMINVEKERGTDRYRGDVLKILSRGTKQVVGQFSKLNDQYGIIKDESLSWGQDLRIRMEDSLGAKPGELVAVEILKYPGEEEYFLGQVKNVIGSAVEPMNDVARVIMAQQIPHEFPKEVLLEAKKFPEVPDEKDFHGRRDLRSKNLITIDGKTAKDFDDAVLVEMSPQGFKLYVAIADVSHYVRPGTAIDSEAYLRGTSVYFPNFVVPMLPEALSNGLCSLNPHVPRLCLVAEMSFDFTGEMTHSTFYEAVMESKARVTYGEAQELIDGVDVPKISHVKDNILLCADLAKILMAKRFKEGSLDLEIPETELEIDASGVPVDVIRSERLFSHRLIEELMLAANVAVAKFLSARQVPSLYRIHEPPNENSLSQLQKYLSSFGGKVDLQSGKLQKRITRALQEFEGRPEAQVLHILTLRSMNQAKYHMGNVGHFGLGFDDYTHFTSPIRRYPDLIIHRLIKNQIMPNSGYRLMSEDELITAGTMLSACEQRSAKAERLIKSIKKARFMEKFVGQTFQGMMSSVVRFGVFVLLREFDIDGLVKLEDLSKEKLEFDEEQLKLVGRRSGASFKVGDPIEIVVDSVDIDLGQINFKLAGATAGTQRSSKSLPDFSQAPRKSLQAQKGHKKSPDQKQKNRRHSSEEKRDFKNKKQNSSSKPSRESVPKNKSGHSGRSSKPAEVSRPTQGKATSKPPSSAPEKKPSFLSRFKSQTENLGENEKKPKKLTARDLFTTRFSSNNKKKKENPFGSESSSKPTGKNPQKRR